MELLTIWRKLLKNNELSLRDDFFECGGNSLLALQLVAQVEDLMQHMIPVALIFKCPSVESFARMLQDKETNSAETSIVPLHPRGSKPPLFVVHGLGGHVFSFMDLARIMDPDQPVYGLQIRQGGDAQPSGGTLSEMAEDYVRQIRSFQPVGPYYFAAYSLGGWIAYEMAQQLLMDGHEVAMLAIFDTNIYCQVQKRVFIPFLAIHLIGRLFSLLGTPLRFRGEEWKKHLTERKAGLYFWFNRWGLMGSSSDDLFGKVIASDPAYEDITFQRVSEYMAKPYGGSIDLFLCKETPLSILWFWKQMARSGVEVHHLPTNHSDVFSKLHLGKIAALFRKTLSERQR